MTRSQRYTEYLIRLVLIAGVIALGLLCVCEARGAERRCESRVCLKRALDWQKQDRLRLQKRLAQRFNRDAQYAIRLAAAAFHIPTSDMRTIAQCESGMGRQVRAEPGSHASGLFQFLPSTWAHTPYASFDVFDPLPNALAAAQLVAHDGSWRQWSCSSITGVR